MLRTPVSTDPAIAHSLRGVGVIAALKEDPRNGDNIGNSIAMRVEAPFHELRPLPRSGEKTSPSRLPPY